MNAEFFVLAFTAALNPKLLAVDLLLIENRRPRAMFICLLLGGFGVGITIGLLDVLVLHLDAIHSQKKISAGVDLALGLLLLLAFAALLVTGRLHTRRQEAVPVGAGPPSPPGEPEKPKKQQKDGWTRLLAEPRLGLAVLVGMVVGIPGATYLAALHILITSKSPVAIQVIGVVLFMVIELLLLIVPFAFLELWPDATKAALQRAQRWLSGHVLQLVAGIALLLGAYLTVMALIRLA
jgi:Sap, sulfolipid-1-addressing protein